MPKAHPRPLSALYALHLGKDACEAHVPPRSKDSPDASRLSRALVCFIHKSKGFQTVGEVHLLAQSIYYFASVYLSRLVLDRNNGVARPSQFSFCLFESIDDLCVSLMERYSIDQTNLHAAVPPDLSRLAYVGSKYLARDMGAK